MEYIYEGFHGYKLKVNSRKLNLTQGCICDLLKEDFECINTTRPDLIPLFIKKEYKEKKKIKKRGRK